MNISNAWRFLIVFAGCATLVHAGTNFPPGGNVSGLTVSKTTALVGEGISFTVKGSGKCAVQLFGFPNAISANARKSGALDLTLSTSINQPGTFTVYVDTVKEPTDPMWCNGSASVQLVVKPAPLEPTARPPGPGSGVVAQGISSNPLPVVSPHQIVAPVYLTRTLPGSVDAPAMSVTGFARTLPTELTASPMHVTGFAKVLPSSIDAPPMSVTGLSSSQANGLINVNSKLIESVKR